MNLQEQVSRAKSLMVINESDDLSIIKRRIPDLERMLNSILSNSYPCDYENENHFMGGVLLDVEQFLSVYELNDLEKLSPSSVRNFIEDYFSEKIIKYFLSATKDCKDDNTDQYLVELLEKSFDKVFDTLELKRSDDKSTFYFYWLSPEGDDIFHRNDYGVFWILNCEYFKRLAKIPKLLEHTYEQFCDNLVVYLNNKYYSFFGPNKPIKFIGNENCPELSEEFYTD